MKSVGSYIKASRKAQKISFDALSEETKIKKEFLEAIEKEKWHKLPEFPAVLGFVKNIAAVLGIDKDKAVALLRRDYPPQKLFVNPQPDLKEGLRLGPKFVFALGVLFVLFLVGSYLVYQYYSFNRPPELTVSSPQAGETVLHGDIEVLGITSREAAVKINNQPATVNSDGSFQAIIEVTTQTEAIVVHAVSRSGKEAVVEIPIDVE